MTVKWDSGSEGSDGSDDDDDDDDQDGDAESNDGNQDSDDSKTKHPPGNENLLLILVVQQFLFIETVESLIL